ncbi:autophagy-related protein Atg28 [Aspergillus cavernicola]|uniref:Autophagy-related protein Atg28 n=1 Tax=Aspergillus cavernicola TaxID=176166 RepID=A0ABR4IKV7_9EURO
MSTTGSHSQIINQSLMPLPLRASNQHQDPLLHVERQAKHLQRNLQRLIDAQSEGLLAGLSRQQPEGSVSSESHVSFSKHASSVGASTVPIRQPPTKKIGLRAAREGIFTSMYDLLKLREEEQDILALRLEERDLGLNEVEIFNTKRAGLEKSISTINDDRETRRSRDLQEESSRLEAEIHNLENKLSQMRARHQNVAQELSQIENSVESKLSSYKASLSLLESDIRRFLANPPVKPSGRTTGRGNFYSLKISRRTLEMAQEHWESEGTELQQRQEEVAAEIEALEEGGGVWKQVIGDVSAFEKRLRETMRQAIQTQSQLLQADEPSSSRGESDIARAVLEDLARTTELVEQHLDYAEERNWRLLVCCISAELQALREAREMFLGVFNVTREETPPPGELAPDDSHRDTDNDLQTDPLGVDESEPPADLLRDIESPLHAAVSKLDDEDDEPDPAWLLSES